MNEEEKEKPKNEPGCMTLIAIGIVILAVISHFFTLLQLYFCKLFHMRCIDEDGERITNPWEQTWQLIGCAFTLYMIGFIYNKITSFFKKE